MGIFNTLDLIAFTWFLSTWIGYTIYAKRKATNTVCLSSVLHIYREKWVSQVVGREQRIMDVALIDTLSKMVNFFASTSLFIIAGLLTSLGAIDEVSHVLSDMPFTNAVEAREIEIKILILIVIFIFAYFKFTWSMRQYSFCSMLIGAAPNVNNGEFSKADKAYIVNTAKICDLAASHFNYGLRTNYFALAYLSWFISPYLLMPICLIVAYVLYRREFSSRTLQMLIDAKG